MFSFLNALRRNERGNVLVIMGAALPLMVGSAGLAVDTIQWALWKRQLQRAADSAAMAGVYERVRAGGSTGGVAAAVTKDLAINQHTGITLLNAAPTSCPVGAAANSILQCPNNVPTSNLRDRVTVTLRLQKPLTFSSMFMSSAPIITAAATAASVPGADSPCVDSRESTTAMGIQGSGNGFVETDCPWKTNSTGKKSAVAKGSSRIKASVIASSGAIEQSANFEVGRYDAYVPQTTDPYQSITPTAGEMRCAVNPATGAALALTETTNVATAVDASGQPANCFSSLSVSSGGTLTLPAGTWFINGGGANIQGTLNATLGSTIVLTNKTGSTIGSLDMNASAKLNITAPTTGKYAGFAIYQDRRATDTGGSENSMPANSPNKINGNSASKITGIVYFPNQQLTYNGNGDGDWLCLRLIARRVQFSGSNRVRFSNAASRCAGTGVGATSGGRRVRLVG